MVRNRKESVEELKNKIKELENINRKNHAILDTTVDALITINEKANVLTFNQSAEAMFGYKAEEVIGKNVKLIMPEPYHGEHDGYVKNYISTGEKKIIGIGREVIAKRKDGTTFPIHLSVGEAEVDSGKLFTGIIRDISESKKAKQELELKTKELQEQSWLKSKRSKLNTLALEAKDLSELAQGAISEIAKMMEIGHGAFYINDSQITNEQKENESFVLYGSFAFKERKNVNGKIAVGEGLVGQCALEKKPILLTKVPADYVQITSGLGEAKPLNIFVVPLIFEKKVLGIIELASFHLFNELQDQLIEQVADDLAININNILGQKRTEWLLEKTRDMAHELQQQQEELKATNEELEQQAEELKASQAKLEQQSEELQASNEELEEKTKRLESQTKDIEQKNDELKIKQKELSVKAKQLEISSKYKSEFLANMSHELRTPLNSLLILSGLLLENNENNLTQEQLSSIEVMNNAGKDLLNLIGDILDLSKIEAGKLKANIELIEIDKVLESVKKQFSPVATKNNIEFKVIRAGNCPSKIQTDSQRLEQIIKNLLSNAFKFTEKGKIIIKVYTPKDNINYKKIDFESGNVIAISISDTGIGIPKEKHMEVFEAFQQVDGSISRKYAGTGLGLAITNQLTSLLGGEIHLESEVNEGATFTVYLPVNNRKVTKKEELKEDIKKTDIINEEETKKPDLKNYNLVHNKKLLIIEDDVNFSNVIKDLAKKKGYDCIVAHDGRNGLKKAIQQKPDAIILDLVLPDVDGISVLEQLKNNNDTKKIPVHISSCKDESSLTLKLGAIGNLLKPASKDDLEKVLTEIEKIIQNPVKEVLIVEDDESNQQAIYKLIANDDVKVQSVERGEKALAMLEKKSFDCIILDLNLPDMTGLNLLQELSNNSHKYHYSPVVIYTGKDLSEDEYNQIKQYATSIVLKVSNSPERLLAEVSLFLYSLNENLPKEMQRNKLKKVKKQDDILRGKRILLADDDMRNIYAMSTVLRNYGLEVTMASNGRKAVDKLLNDPNFDLILMDIMMPELNGYEAIKEIRQNDKLKNIPIIAVTAKAMVGDEEKCIQAGANDYIAKPVDISLLISMMKIWLLQKDNE